MKIRNANVDDAKAISEGEYATAVTPGLLNAQPGEIPLAAYIEKIQSLTADPKGIYVVAEIDEQIIGHVFLDPLPLAANAHICALTIVVYPGWQGRGVGRELMQHVIRWAERIRGIEKIELRVRASNERAIALYRNMGFEEEGRIRRRVKINETYLDDIAMGVFF
jgi:RimJ/RimL family protein N-acetyltransferase